MRLSFFFFFNDTATTEIYTLSLHDALPICGAGRAGVPGVQAKPVGGRDGALLRPRRWVRDSAVRVEDQAVERHPGDRKSTRLNSSHGYISYAVFCLKKKNKR